MEFEHLHICTSYNAFQMAHYNKKDCSETLVTIIGPSGGIYMIYDIMLSNLSYFYGWEWRNNQ